MSKPTSLLLLSILVLRSPHQAWSSDTTTAAGLITKICDHALNRQLCRRVLESGSSSEGDRDLYGLAVIALKAAKSNASAIFDYINEIANIASEDPFLQECLTGCLDDYQDAMDQIEDSLAALDTRGYSDVNAWIGAAVSDADACEQGFKERTGYKSPLTDMNKVFDQLCSIALAISNLLIET